MNADAVADVLPMKKGELFDRSKINKSIEELKEWAQSEGYTFIDIITNLNDNNELNQIDVKLIINEGPRVYVNNINIAGNTRTVDKVIRREISLTEGDAYNKYSIIYSKDAIRALNFFSKVDIQEVKTSFPDKINLEINVDEKNT